MIPTLIKVMVFMFLQGGTGQKESKNGFQVEQVTFAKNMTLSIEADEYLVDRVIALCLAQDIRCQIRREGSDETGKARARVDFANLAFTKRDKIMEQFNSTVPQPGFGLYWSD